MNYEKKLDSARSSLLEALAGCDDVDGDAAWSRLIGGTDRPHAGPGAWSEVEWEESLRACRALSVENEFAINGHENRISYLVGRGHVYRVSPRKGCEPSPHLAGLVQSWIDDFQRENEWTRRQREIVKRRDRDGEAFLRLFVDGRGKTRVRFVEPEQIRTPTTLRHDAWASWGILTEPGDVEHVKAYFVDGEAVPARWIQHRKGNVDSNVKRGAPLFYPVRKNLKRAERLLRNMSALAEVQAAIALIRRHTGRSKTAIKQFVDDQSERVGGERIWRYAPGTILDADAGTEYEFPAAKLNAGHFVIVLQAELRAIASRLVMPEFMLSSDASNGNYASTLVAEGPALKMFERLQSELVEEDLALFRLVVKAGVEAERLPREAITDVEIEATPPLLAARDRLQEARVRRIEFESGLLSRQTWSRMSGLDYDQEQRNLREETERDVA